MSLTVIILLILLAIYVPVWIWTYKSPKAKEHGFEIYGPAIKINTSFGIKTMDRFCRYKRFWNAYGVFSQIVSVILMATMIFLMAMAVYQLPQTLKSGGIGVEYALALPGLNPIMPFWFTLLALIIALVLHEMAHGLQARANGIGVVHTGLLYGVVPLGAFVEPDDQQAKKASRKARLHLYSAGIVTNFVIGAVSFLLFSVVLLGGLSSPYDNDNVHMAGVYSNVDSEGIPAGQIIMEIDGGDYTYSDILSPRDQQDLWDLGTTITVHYKTESSEQDKDIIWGVYVATVSSDSPAEKAGLQKGDVICYISGASSDDGTKYLYSQNAFTSYMSTTRQGDKVTIGFYDKSASAMSEVTVDLASKGSIGFLGVSVNTAGMSLATPSQVLDIATNPFYGRDTVPQKAIGLVGYLSNPFSGFQPLPDSIHWWFGEQFTGFWTLVSIFYWLFWLNMLLGVTNALPALPFDGGLILSGWVDGLLERFGKNKDPARREAQVNEITRNVSMMMLVLFAVVIISAIL